MKQRICKYFRLVFFYLIMFAFWRAFFLLINSGRNQFEISEALLSFLHGARMDLSLTAYLMIPPLLHEILSSYLKVPRLRPLAYGYHLLLIVLITFVCSGNVIIYHYWGGLINYRAVSYLTDPVELMNSLTPLTLIIFVFAFLLIISLKAFSLKRFVFKEKPAGSESTKVFKKVFLHLSTSALLVLAMRGGWQMLPMNESLVYFSKNNFLNQTAINPVWHLAYEFKNAGSKDKNPFQKFDDAFADRMTAYLLSDSAGTWPQVLEKKLPNIVMIMLESHSADVVSALGGEDISPNLDKLIANGFSFSEIYSSGSRTDQGIVSLINGWPATPYHSIMKATEKSNQLPSLLKLFADSGYVSSFYYGGESNFSNMNVYLLNQGFDRTIDRRDFPSGTPSGRWGVYDEELFKRMSDDLDKEKRPFFSVLLTLSNHEPFDVPGPKRIEGKTEPDKFRNAAAYTDACLGKFFLEAKNKEWFKNTLFIIAADHGHILPKEHNEIWPESKHIPMLFYGDPVREEFRGKNSSKLGGHHDLPATLLAQLGISAERFSWSKNLLSEGTKEFAYFQIESVMGWKQKGDFLVYLFTNETILVDQVKTENRDSMLVRSQAFLQKLYGEYLAY